MPGRRLILVMTLLLANGCRQTPRAEPVTVEPPQAPERVVEGLQAGLITLGQPLPSALFAAPKQGTGDHPNAGDYDFYYWDMGYFEGRHLRLIYLDMADAIVVMSPKHTTYQVLVGPTYQTPQQIRIGGGLQDLGKAYADIDLQTVPLDQALLYRPDRVTWHVGATGWMGSKHQSSKVALACRAVAPALANVAFFFETCAAANDGGPIEAILLTNPDDTDLRPVDPIVDLNVVPPCPKPRTETPSDLASEGLAILALDKLGDHYAEESVQRALPILRDAALSGSAMAGQRYAGILNMYIGQEVLGDPLDRPIGQGAREALLFSLLATIRSGETPVAGSCDEAFLAFETPLTQELFPNGGSDEASPCEWFFTHGYMALAEMEATRRQARAWAQCWPAPIP
jgi:hypothetical protein